MTREEKLAKLVDPEFHFAYLASELRKKLMDVHKAYNDCLEYGLMADWYIGPNKTYTYLPDDVKLKRTQSWHY